MELNTEHRSWLHLFGGGTGSGRLLVFAAKLGHVLRVSVRDVDQHEWRLATRVPTHRLVRLIADVVAASLQLDAVALAQTPQLVIADERELVLENDRRCEHENK